MRKFSALGNYFFMGIKINFKCQNSEKFTKDFHVQFFSIRILCKINPEKLKGILLSFFHGGQVNKFPVLVKQVFYGKEIHSNNPN